MIDLTAMSKTIDQWTRTLYGKEVSFSVVEEDDGTFTEWCRIYPDHEFHQKLIERPTRYAVEQRLERTESFRQLAGI